MYPRDTMIQPYSNYPSIEAAYQQPSVSLRTQQPAQGQRSYFPPPYVGANYLF